VEVGYGWIGNLCGRDWKTSNIALVLAVISLLGEQNL